MRWLFAFLLGATLASCGADGEPVTPTADTAVTVSNNGVYASTRVGVSRGPVSVSLGLGL